MYRKTVLPGINQGLELLKQWDWATLSRASGAARRGGCSYYTLAFCYLEDKKVPLLLLHKIMLFNITCCEMDFDDID